MNPSDEFIHCAMSEEKETCKATIKSQNGDEARCWRPAKENGYCGKHITAAGIQEAIDKGLIKCKTHRCTTMIDKSSIICPECLERKDEEKKKHPRCIALIEQNKNKGKQCQQAAVDNGFCGKHSKRGKLAELAKTIKKRICDDGKRSCKNFTENQKLHCNECLKKSREEDTIRHTIRRETPNTCYGCGKSPFIRAKGVLGELQQCEECYEKMLEVELNRKKRERNYNAERTKYMETTYNAKKTNAIGRNMAFHISFDFFKELISKECIYCGEKRENEINGIDRVDSTQGYIESNCVPCCSTCNFMKGELPQQTFLNQITKIYKYRIENNSNTDTLHMTPNNKTRYYTNEIADLILAGNQEEYIKWCIEQKRSANYIATIRNLAKVKQSKLLIIQELRKAAKTATKAENLDLTERKRIGIKELVNMLDQGRYKEVIMIQENLHGKVPEFEADILELMTKWNDLVKEEKEKQLIRIRVKYQNLRNRSKESTTIYL
jgi:Family of unknown function (DUF5763)